MTFSSRKRPMLKPTDGMILLGYLVLPHLLFAECPRSPGAFGVQWIDLFSNDLTAHIDRAFTPIFVCLLLVVCIIATFETGRDGIQPGRNETRNPEHSIPSGRNPPHRKGTV